jgi:NAD(P)-dependent dehydrogenase (short-subunit alcohol dehydrogenase family)
VVVVTGATGMAAAGARLFAREGAAVFVVSLQAEDCERLATDVGGEGGTVEWAAADLTEEEAAVGAVARCVARFGRVDGLFAVAGVSGRPFGDGPLHAVPLRGWEETVARNGLPMFLAAREVLRAMVDRGSGGSVVLISSVLAEYPSPRLFATHAYAAVKGAVLSLTRAAAAYYAPFGIRVNALTPGLVDTPMAARAAADPETVAYARRKQPLAGGLLPPEAVARAALFLLSDDARYVTGQVIAVDGGWSVTEAWGGEAPTAAHPLGNV